MPSAFGSLDVLKSCDGISHITESRLELIADYVCKQLTSLVVSTNFCEAELGDFENPLPHYGRKRRSYPSRYSSRVAVPLDVHLDMDTFVVMPMHKGDVTVLGKDGICVIEESIPTFAVTIHTQPRRSSKELARVISVYLHSPQVHLLEVVLGWGHALQVEHYVIKVCWNYRRSEDSLG